MRLWTARYTCRRAASRLYADRTAPIKNITYNQNQRRTKKVEEESKRREDISESLGVEEVHSAIVNYVDPHNSVHDNE